ncbi:MAG: hypothetical protein HQL24_04220 [Candidatus Omnitrophica bacterium]|nr:hypothetical protein [Candidatus Omnitrophota bacterium]
MVKHLVCVCALVFLVGCGSNNAQEKAQEFPQQPQQDVNYIEQGMKALAQKNPVSAVQNFDLAIQQDPKNVDKYVTVGEIYLMLKNYQKTEKIIAAAITLDPTRGELYYLLATTEMLLGKKAEAIDAAKKSVYLFSQKKDEERTKRAAVLLRSLMEPAPAAPVSASAN